LPLPPLHLDNFTAFTKQSSAPGVDPGTNGHTGSACQKATYNFLMGLRNKLYLTKPSTKIQLKIDGLMAGTIAGETKKKDKKGGSKKGQKTNNPPEWKQNGRELVPLMVGSYLTHCPSNLNYIYI